MNNICIPRSEFKARIARIQAIMKERAIDAFFVYGDEYRKENLRYVSNFWPIFERGALLCTQEGEAIVLCAPEGEQVAKEMSVWTDVRLVPDFLCVTVPDEIDYPMATYTSFKKLACEIREKGKLEKLGVVGLQDMSGPLTRNMEAAFDCEILDCADILYDLRKNKSANEIACLKEAARMAEAGYRKMMQANLVGMTERQAAAIAEGECRAQGAETIIFTVFGSGDRTHKIIGRAENKVIEDGDMIMCALAVQYEGYVATYNLPFAVGNYTAQTKRVIDVLVKASAAGKPYLKAGVPMKKFVTAVRDVFREERLAEYDIYPPLHGIGCAEAESPYPNENTEAVFTPGMCVNTDISLFGLAGGSNRIEEGFIITEEGADTICPFMREYYENWLKTI